MGSLISLELFSIDILVNPFADSKPTENWAKMTFFLLTFILFMFFAIILFLRYRNKLQKRTSVSKPIWRPPPTLLVILTIIAIISVFNIPAPSECTPIRHPTSLLLRKKPFTHRIAKPLAKTTVPLLATTALYFGLEAVAQFLEDNPEFSNALIGLFIALFLILLISAIKLVV